MRRLISFAIPVFICVLALVAFFTGRVQASDQSQIQSLYQRFATAFRNRDLNGIMSVYIHDNSLFVFDVTPPRQHVGWNDYRDDWRGTFAAMKQPVRFTIHDLHVISSGDVAYSHSAQEISAPSAKSGTMHFIVRVTDVLRRINGKWLIVQEHVSVPVDIMSGKPDMMSKP